MKKRILYVAGILLLFLILTNPTKKDFEEYSNATSVTKKWNFFVCSIYEVRIYSTEPLYPGEEARLLGRIEYFGICKNFIEL